MDIPPYIQAPLGIGAAVTKDELEQAADQWPLRQDIFGLSANEFANAAETVDPAAVVDMASMVRVPNDWRYIELISDGMPRCFGICTPGANAPEPSTALGEAAVKAWFGNPNVVQNDSIPTGLLIRSISPGYPKKDFANRLIGTWAHIPLLPEEFSSPPVWLTKNEILMPLGSRILKSVQPLNYQSLFIEAVSEIKSKWRYLSLYRVLEHGYLSDVLEKVNREFFRAPKESLQQALDAVESEAKSFISLADSAGLRVEFEGFYDKFYETKNGLNRFANALHHSLQQKGAAANIDKWAHGVVICYKVRNSIVHAGLSSPFIEAYDDGDACLENLLPTLESIVLKFLGVTIT